MKPPNKLYIGIDEVGIGCLAGPFYVSGVVWPVGEPLAHVRDSKKLSAARMRLLTAEIRARAVESHIVSVPVKSIDRIGTWKAWDQAVKQLIHILRSRLGELPVIIDGTRRLNIHSLNTLTKGDNKLLNIAAASVLAKHSRDQYMQRLHDEHPEYHWCKNVGYGTKDHLDAMIKYGLTQEHRHAASMTSIKNRLAKERRS